MRLLRLPLFLLLLCATLAWAGDAGNIAITAPGTIWTTDDEIAFAWSLVNGHEVVETKSVKDTTAYSWKPKGLKDGDEVQVWVYDSSGMSGKTAQIAVQQGDEGGDEGGAKSKTTTTTSTKAAASSSKVADEDKASETSSSGSGGSKPGGGNGSTSSTKGLTTASGAAKATGVSAAGDDEEEDEGVRASGASLLESAASSTTSFSGTSTHAAASSVATAGVVADSNSENTNAATVVSSAASTSQDTSSTSSWGDRKTLYLGLGGLALAFFLGLAIYLWWRQNQQPSDGDRRREGREERSLGKGPVRTHPTPLRSLTEALTHPTLQKQPRRRPKLLVIPSVERAALLSPDDLERGGLSSSPLSATSSRSSASSSSSSSDERDIGRRRKKGRAG
ncbi:hypothetical protein DMC30DRAFT_408610 [Rhodotorula diobovata]|uniref:Proteophosphoglycan ppg4 n=1 Tax=Rhodotorula diobovata TaxID=5288 RepID=A0A5C5FX38_9BASI|nr:hypothetical protein DMC30DRAFT_408610 [Rhodotorula diobovata]